VNLYSPGALVLALWAAPLTAAAAAAARFRPMMAAMEKSVARGLLMAAALEAAPGMRGEPAEAAGSRLEAGDSIIDPSNMIAAQIILSSVSIS